MPVISRWSMRRRIVVVAAAALVALLAISVAVFGFALRGVLIQDATDVARTQAYQLARLVESGQSAPQDAVHELPSQGMLMQAVSGGRVLAGSESGQAQVPLSSLTPDEGQSVAEVRDGIPGDDDSYVVVAQTASDPAGGRATLVVAKQLDVEARTVTTASALLGVGAMGLGTLLLLLVDRIVLGALQPVARITAQVGRITRARTGERVTVPPSGDEIATLATTMNEMLARLARADEATHRFVSDASHELRSPLATLRTHIETATGPDDLDQPLIHSEVLRLQSLVDDLLTLAKSDDQGLRLAAERVDLDDVVDGEVRRLRAVTSATVTSAIEPVEGEADQGRLTQILRNVLDNAARHAESRIRVETGTDGQTAFVHIDNDGPPIDSAERELVFDRFTRLDESRERDGGGSGLGLAIARTLAQAHGGALTTGEAPDGWCRFTLTLPVPDE